MLVKDGPDRDELSREAEAVMEDAAHPLGDKSAGSQGLPELLGWRGGGELASTACSYPSHKLEGTGGKDKTHSCKPLMGKARGMHLPKIEEGLQQSTLRSEEIKEAREAGAPVEEAVPAGEVEGAPAEPAEMETPESAAEGINGTAALEDSAAGDDLEETCKLAKEICELSEAGLNDVSDSSEISGNEGDDTEEPLGDTAALEDVTAEDAGDHSQGDIVAGNAAGSNPKELDREAGLEDAATNTPLRRTQRFRKKTKKASELDLCDL